MYRRLIAFREGRYELVAMDMYKNCDHAEVVGSVSVGDDLVVCECDSMLWR